MSKILVQNILFDVMREDEDDALKVERGLLEGEIKWTFTTIVLVLMSWLGLYFFSSFISAILGYSGLYVLDVNFGFCRMRRWYFIIRVLVCLFIIFNNYMS